MSIEDYSIGQPCLLSPAEIMTRTAANGRELGYDLETIERSLIAVSGVFAQAQSEPGAFAEQTAMLIVQLMERM